MARPIFGTHSLSLRVKLGLVLALLAVAPSAVLVSGHPSPPASQGNSEEGGKIEAVTAKHYGFEPSEITRRPGPFTLAVHNSSGSGELALRLDRVGGGRVSEMPIRHGKRASHRQLTLTPGEYLLTEANHPEWRCRIVIAN